MVAAVAVEELKQQSVVATAAVEEVKQESVVVAATVGEVKKQPGSGGSSSSGRTEAAVGWQQQQWKN